MKNFLRSLGLTALAATLTSCNLLVPRADPVRHFTLSAPANLAPVQQGTLVRPVLLAGHLHGRQMAVRVGEHEVIYLADVRWAESLDSAITQLLRARLGAISSGVTVTVEVQRCELNRANGNTVQLAATYAILPADGSAVAAQRGSFTTTARVWEGRGIPTESLGSSAAIREFPVSLMALRWRGAMKPPTPISAKFFMS